jgi:hypothetical protein
VANFAIPSQHLKPDTAVVTLTTVQLALWQLGMPILDAGAVAKYKKGAKRGMLWQAIRWQLLAMAALVALISLGHQPGRAAAVGAAAVVLATLFGWLVNSSDLQWRCIDYSTYQSLHVVPQHVSTAANALVSRGVPQERIGVEFLKTDPILFVEEGPGINRYDLIVW